MQSHVANGVLENGTCDRLRDQDFVHRDLDNHSWIRAVSILVDVHLGNKFANTVIENLHCEKIFSPLDKRVIKSVLLEPKELNPTR